MDDPAARARGDRAAGPHPARHRPRLPHALRRGGRRHLHAGDRRLGVERVPAGAPRARRRARRARRLDAPARTGPPTTSPTTGSGTPRPSTPPSATRASSRICGTPLLVKDEFVGVLFAANRSPRTFTPDEVALLGSLAALAAVLAGAGRGASTRCAAHTEGLERAAAAHDRFAGIVLRGGGVGEITEALHSLLGVLGRARRRRGRRAQRRRAGPDLPAGGRVRRAAHDGTVRRRRPARHRRPADPHRRPLGRRRSPPSTCRWASSSSAARVDLDEADRRTVERAAVVTALVLLGERQRADAQLQVRTDLVADLLSGPGRPAGRRRRPPAPSGVDLRSPCCVLVATAPDAATSRRSLVMSVTAALGGAALVAEHRGEVVAVVQRDDPSAAAVELAQRMSRAQPAHRRRLRAGRRVHGRCRRPTARRGARHPRWPPWGAPGRGGSAADLGFAGLIVGSDPEVRDYVRSVLGPLLDYDDAARRRPRAHRRGLLPGRVEPAARGDGAARARQHRRPAAAPHRRAARRRLAGPAAARCRSSSRCTCATSPAEGRRPPWREPSALVVVGQAGPARHGARLLEGQGVAQGLARAGGSPGRRRGPAGCPSSRSRASRRRRSTAAGMPAPSRRRPRARRGARGRPGAARRSTRATSARRREHLGRGVGRAGGVERAVEPLLGRRDQPGREVADVDDRAGEVELVGHDDALPHRVREAPRPVAGAARPVAGAADQAGAHDRRRARRRHEQRSRRRLSPRRRPPCRSSGHRRAGRAAASPRPARGRRTARRRCRSTRAPGARPRGRAPPGARGRDAG